MQLTNEQVCVYNKPKFQQTRKIINQSLIITTRKQNKSQKTKQKTEKVVCGPSARIKQQQKNKKF